MTGPITAFPDLLSETYTSEMGRGSFHRHRSTGLEARFAVPEFADPLPRPRVCDALAKAVACHRITLLTAPSGYGKTTAVAEWTRTCGHPVAWLSLNRYDTDPAAISEGIAAALRRLAVTMARDDILDALAVIDAAEVGALHEAVGTAVDVVGEPIVLVVDDLQRSGAAANTSVLGALLEQGPAGLRLLLIGHDPHQLPVSSQILAGDATRLDSSALLFTAAEIQSAAGLAARSATEVDSMLNRTGGWAAAVRVALLASGQTGAAAGHPTRAAAPDDLLLDVIADEVLPGLPPELAAFLLDVTTVSELDGVLAAGISGRSDALALLEECRRRGLFLDRFGTDGAAQYRWHDVFASRCRKLVALRDPEHSRALHLRAAELLTTRQPLHAIDEALLGGDPRRATEILVDSWILLLAGRAEESPERVLTRIPEPYASRDDVRTITACAIDLAGRRAEAQAPFTSRATRTPRPESSERTLFTDACARLFLCDDRAELIEALGVAHDNLSYARSLGAARYAAAQLLLGRAHFMLRYEMHDGIALLTSAETLGNDAGEATIARRAAGLLSFCSAWVGDHGASREILARIQSSDEYSDSWSTQVGAPELAAEGWIAYWEGDFAAARTAFTKTIDAHAVAVGISSIARQYLVLIAALDGDATERRNAYSLVRQMPDHEVRGVPWELYRVVALAKLAEADGDDDRAGRLIRGVRVDWREIPASATVAVDLIRRHVGRHAAAAMVKQLAPLPLGDHIRASLLVTSALIHRADGDYPAAHEVLERALTVATAGKIAKPFLDTDPALADLLAEHARWGTSHAAFIAALKPPTRVLNDLSDRENQILGYLRTTMTLAEIAAEVGLSINTVKTHTRTLYRKLSVGNRRDAITAVARRR